MPHKRKDSAVWWVSYTDPSGKRVRRSTGTTDKKEAKGLEAKWKLEAFRVTQWDQEPARSFEEVMLVYLNAKKDMRSIEDLRYIVKRLNKRFAGFIMNGISAKDVSIYIAERKADGMSNATINRELEVLCASINLANKELEWNLPNPVRGRKLKEPEGRVRWLATDEADRLLAAAVKSRNARHLVDFIIIALHTGMRKNEILGMEWNRVDLQAGLMHLEPCHNKSAKRRSIPVNKVARNSLIRRMRFRAEHCPDSRWVFCNKQGARIQDVKSSFNTACRKLGIKDFRVHDLRHTCAAWLVSSGVALSEVRDLLGHSSITVTERYAHLAPENVRVAVSKLEELSRFGHAGNDQQENNVVKLLI